MSVQNLVAELEQTYAQYKAILDEHEGKEVPAEKAAELDRLYERAMQLREQIEAQQRQARRERDMAEVADFLTKPQYKLPRPFNPDDDGRQLLLASGWEVKGGIVYAPTSLGQMQPLFPEDVLFGPAPEGDTVAAAYIKATRAAMQPLYRQAYAKWLRNAVKVRSESMAFALLDPQEQKALSEGQDGAGGYLVPPDLQAEILVRVAQRAVMRRYARVVTTSRDRVVFPRVEGHSSQGSIYSSGFVGSWAAETPAFSDTDPRFGTLEIGVKKVRVATRLSNDFIADAVVNILAWLAANGSENMALVEDEGFINGDGTPLRPLGVLNGGAPTVDVEGTTADTISNTTANLGSAPKLIDLVYALPSQYAERAVILLRRAVEGKIFKLVDAQGRPYFGMPIASGQAAPRTLMGYPLVNSDFMPSDGTAGAKVVLFGDLSSYIIVQRAQISTVVLRERFADTDQTGIILFSRVGGAPWNPDAIRIGVV